MKAIRKQSKHVKTAPGSNEMSTQAVIKKHKKD